MQSTLILFLTHRWDRSLAERFLRLRRETRPFGDCRLLLQDDHGPVRAAWLDSLERGGEAEAIEFFDASRIEAELGYPFLSRVALTPGSTHYPLLQLARRTRHARYWLIEFDVECSRPWQEFFAAFERCDADLLASHVLSRMQRPSWFWWDLLHPPQGGRMEPSGQWRAFFPIYRISRKALEAIDDAHRAGWEGHYECLVPTVLRQSGCEVRDLREIIPCYTGTEQDPGADNANLSSMRFRPEITLQELTIPTPVPRLLHPVKSGITVVMATCNGAKVVGTLLESLARQTRKPDQLIVVDDASEDGTLDVVARLAAQHGLRPVAFRQPRRAGHSACLLAGTAVAGGDLILFCEQEDVWHPEKIGCIERQVANSDKDVFTHDLEIPASPDEQPITSVFAPLQSHGLPSHACIAARSLALRRSFLLRWGPPPAGHFTCDEWFVLLAVLTDRHACLSQVLGRGGMAGADRGFVPESPPAAVLAAPPGGLSAAELVLALCVRSNVAERLAVLEQVLRSRLEPAEPEVLAAALRVLERHRAGGRDARPAAVD